MFRTQPLKSRGYPLVPSTLPRRQVPFLNEWGRKILLWDQTWKFEMNRLEDGRYEVKHVCTKFQGPFPIRLIIWLHQRYVTESAPAQLLFQ